MSRFFVSGYNSDSSSSEEDLLSASEDELLSSTSEMSDDSEFANDSDSDSDDSDSDASPSGPAYFLKKSFVKGAKGGSDSDSDSEDEGRKVVKSAKDKLLDDMTQAVDLINTAKRNNAWTSALAEFDRLGRLLIRANKQKTGIPNFFIKCLVSLESYINETTESEKSQKTLNAAEGRAFNTTHQRVKKQVKEFQAHYDLYKASPELFDQDEPVEIVDKDALGNAQQQDSERRLLSPVFSTLRQVAETRGKKNVDKYEQILSLELLVETTAPSGTPFELISIFQMLLSVRFDLASNQTFMPLTQWKSCEKDFNSLLDLLERNISLYQVSELGVPTDDIDIEPTPNDLGVRILTGSVVSLVERLDDELTRSLQNTDSHSSDYLERLKDETIMYKLIVRVQAYMEAITSDAHYQSSEQLARIVMKRFEHVYYKPSDLILANESCAWATIPADSKVASKSSTPAELVDGLSKYLHEHVNHGYRQDALLYSIYFYAVNGQYAKARDMFLTSQIFASIHLAESNVQVHYNRALVQLGLSAFRSGSIDECNKILTEIVNSQRSKELLGQGFASKYPNQATTAEKLKLLPFHQHINLELLDSVYMTCSLLIEIPIIASAAASSSKDSKRKASIKSFKSKLDFYDRQYFAGPPESIKDHIVHASIALQKGDWVKSYDLLSSIKVWKLLPRTDELLAMIKGQLQVEGLRTYIFSYKTIFSKLSVSKLAQKFQMTQDRVSNILNRMLEANEISGSFNDERTFLNFSSNEPQRSRLQELAIV
ncbi:MAG: PCI domain-containing protein, partial [Janthinobacterium lividum]